MRIQSYSDDFGIQFDLFDSNEPWNNPDEMSFSVSLSYPKQSAIQATNPFRLPADHVWPQLTITIGNTSNQERLAAIGFTPENLGEPTKREHLFNQYNIIPEQNSGLANQAEAFMRMAQRYLDQSFTGAEYDPGQDAAAQMGIVGGYNVETGGFSPTRPLDESILSYTMHQSEQYRQSRGREWLTLFTQQQSSQN